MGRNEVADVFPWLGASCCALSVGCVLDKSIHASSALCVFQGIKTAVQWLEEVSLADWVVLARDSAVPSVGDHIDCTRDMHIL